jgi:hypothetical protein
MSVWVTYADGFLGAQRRVQANATAVHEHVHDHVNVYVDVDVIGFSPRTGVRLGMMKSKQGTRTKGAKETP